ETAAPVAAGSEASASTRICGLSRRTTPRVKSPGMVIANWTAPPAPDRTRPPLAQPVHLGRGAGDMVDAEIVAALQRADHRAGELALVLDQHRGRQMLGIGVDR